MAELPPLHVGLVRLPQYLPGQVRGEVSQEIQMTKACTDKHAIGARPFVLAKGLGAKNNDCVERSSKPFSKMGEGGIATMDTESKVQLASSSMSIRSI